MVFFQQELSRSIMIHPQYLGKNLRTTIKEQLVSEVEGMSVDNSGFIITVLSIKEENFSNGLIDHLTGFVKYNIVYNALMFRPFKGEVVDAKVMSVSDLGFFAEAGPLSIFLSRVHIPSDIGYDAEDMSYSADDSSGKIKVGCTVRMRIIGSSVQQTTLCAIGSMNEPYLGLIT